MWFQLYGFVNPQPCIIIHPFICVALPTFLVFSCDFNFLNLINCSSSRFFCLYHGKTSCCCFYFIRIEEAELDFFPKCIYNRFDAALRNYWFRSIFGEKTLFLFYTDSSFRYSIKRKEHFSALTLTWIKSHIRRTKHEKGPVEIITLATRVESIVWTKLTVTARRRITLQIEKGTMSATSNPVCSKTTPGADYRPCLTNNPRWRNLSLPWFRFF